MPSFLHFIKTSGEVSMNGEIFDTEVITSKTNSTIVKIGKLSNKKYRNEYKMFVCDGVKLFQEAMDFGAKIEYIIIKNEAVFDEKIVSKIKDCQSFGAKILCVNESVFDKLTDESAPQGIITVVSYFTGLHRRLTNVENADEKEKIMMLESIRDPGNMGTIIRNAVAFGIDRLILSSDCVDIYSSKVVRAAMGAIFKIKIDIVDNFVYSIQKIKSTKTTLGAALGKKSLVLGERNLSKNDVVIIGNEGHGLSQEVLDTVDDTIFIPMAQNTESLNAAMASVIFMWEIYK